MFSVYIRFLCGFIFGFLALVEVLLIVYKISKKNENFRTNVILGVLFVILSTICISSAVYYILTNIDYERITNELVETQNTISQNIQDGFSIQEKQ